MRKTISFLAGIFPWLCFTLYGKLHGYRYYVVSLSSNERRSPRSFSYVHWTHAGNAEELKCPEFGSMVYGPFDNAKEAESCATLFNAIG